MTREFGTMREGWRGASTGTRLWWSGVVAMGLAGALLLGGVAIADAAGSPAAPAAAPAAAGPAMPAMADGMGTSSPSGSGAGSSTAMQAGGASGSSMSMGAGATTTGSSFCPNVSGTTVMADGMVMAPVPSTPPTPAQQQAAATLVASVEKDIQQYASLQTAEADGYEPISKRHLAMTHYLNRSVVRSGDVLDPAHPSALMFANTVNGPVLVGAMFLGPAPCVPGPDLGGSLTQWHAHDNLCLSGGQIVGRTSGGSCTLGTSRDSGYFMLHVWTAPQLAAKYQFQADLPAGALSGIDASGQA